MPPNLLLLVLDCVRADGLGSYGNPLPVTPRLDNLAAASRRYTQARAASVWTLESHASLFTGLFPRQHGVNVEQRLLDPALPTLAAALRELGYQTAAFSTNAWVGPHFGLDRGFERFYSLWRLLPSQGRLPFPRWEKALRKRVFERHDKGAAKLNTYVQRWWARERDPARPFFLFGLYLDAHLPYQPPPGYAERLLQPAALRRARQANQDAWAYMAGEIPMTDLDFLGLRALYDAEINYVDHKLGELLDFLGAVGGLENTMIIVTADHGENIGDHGLMDHQYCVYDSLAHVPLLIHYPSVFPPGDDDAPVQHTDLFPTLLDLAAAPPDHRPPPRAEPLGLSLGTKPQDEALPGRSLLSSDFAIRNSQFAIIQYTAPHRHRFARRHPRFDPASKGYDRTFDALVRGGYKLIRSSRGESELYDVEDDPGECQDLAAAQPQRVADLAAALDARLSSLTPAAAAAARLSARDEAPAATLDPGLERHLRSLGYL